MGTPNSKNKINKENTLLNIYVCNSDQQIRSIKFIEDVPNNNLIEDINYIEYRHKFYGWNFYDYGNINDNKIKIIRNKIISEVKNKNFKNVLLYFVKNSNNNDDLEIMKSIAQIRSLKGSKSEYYQPLLLYISKSKEKNTKYYRKKLSELLNKSEKDKYKMDRLNITSLFYNRNTFNSELINELWQMTIYFNQIPSCILPMSQTDDKLEIRFENNVFTLNFLLAGKSGTGKSSFINILKGRKIAYQSDEGIVKTNKINHYIISIHPENEKLNDPMININNIDIDDNNNIYGNNLIEDS